LEYTRGNKESLLHKSALEIKGQDIFSNMFLAMNSGGDCYDFIRLTGEKFILFSVIFPVED